MRYSIIPSQERTELSSQFNIWGNKTNSFVRPFQDDYRDVIRCAVDLAKYKRVSHITDYDEKSRALYNLTPAVYGFGDDNIQIYVLSAGFVMPYHGSGDVAVLHLKKEPYSHIVLSGESMKQWLDRGVADFIIPAKDIGKELEDVIMAWKKFSAQYVDSSSFSSRRKSAETISSMMILYDPVNFVETYLYPISQGFNRPENYEDEIRDLLMKSPLALSETSKNLPSPFIPVRAFN